MFNRGYVQVNKNEDHLGDEEANINPMMNVELTPSDSKKPAENTNGFRIKVLYKERTYELNDLTPTTTIMELKRRIEAITEVPVLRQRLIATGKPLKPDEKTLEFFKIIENTSVHLFPIPEVTAAPVVATPTATNATPTADIVNTYNNAWLTPPNNGPSFPAFRSMYYDMAMEQSVREVKLWCFILVSLSAMELLLNFNYLTATGKIGHGTLDSILFVFDTICSLGGVWVGTMGMKSLRTMDIADIRKYVQWLGILAVGCIILRILWVADVIEQVKEAVKESKENNANSDSNATDDPKQQQQLDDRAVVTFGVQAFIVATICIGAWISCFRRAIRFHLTVMSQPTNEQQQPGTSATVNTAGENIPTAQASE